MRRQLPRSCVIPNLLNIMNRLPAFNLAEYKPLIPVLCEAMAAHQVSVWGVVAVLCCLALGLSFHVDPVAAEEEERSRFKKDGGSGLRRGFYQGSCPNVESIVFSSMQNSYNVDKSIAPGVLRASFHDCFVRGCDGSLLLDGADTERKSFGNNFRQSTFDAIDAAKRAVESVCPGIVSCADVLQFAARDAVILAGGQGWAVPAGRRDGTISLAAEADVNLPGPVSNAPQLISVFQKKGLTVDQMVTLSGAHTIGTASCIFFDNRIHGATPDPSLPPKIAASLLGQCPTPQLFNRVSLDSTPEKFDTQYFLAVAAGNGLFTSDESLMDNRRTRRSVLANVMPFAFSRNFADAMVAMSQIEVLTGDQGEIRRQTNKVNGPSGS